MFFLPRSRALVSMRRTEALASVEISCFLFVSLFFAYVLSGFNDPNDVTTTKKKVNESLEFHGTLLYHNFNVFKI